MSEQLGSYRRYRGTVLVWIWALTPLVLFVAVIIVGLVLAVTKG